MLSTACLAYINLESLWKSSFICYLVVKLEKYGETSEINRCAVHLINLFKNVLNMSRFLNNSNLLLGPSLLEFLDGERGGERNCV